MQLDERKTKILQAIIRNYLETGEPVGSRTISKYTDLNLSSATIRNEMADLEELGYIVQPHTSAGRIPSDQGYRFYVDCMMEQKEQEVVEMKEMLLERQDRMENLLKQVAFEMSDKLGEAGLDVRMNLTEEKVILPLDSQKTYRIYENLFGNIAKYALPGTRVYVNGFRIGDTVIITLKNISAQEITVDSSELTERFVRGDASRNTEGSGLGLAIAKSFMEL